MASTLRRLIDSPRSGDSVASMVFVQPVAVQEAQRTEQKVEHPTVFIDCFEQAGKQKDTDIVRLARLRSRTCSSSLHH